MTITEEHVVLFLINSVFLVIGFLMGRSRVKIIHTSAPAILPPLPKAVKEKEKGHLVLGDEDPFQDALQGSKEQRIDTIMEGRQ